MRVTNAFERKSRESDNYLSFVLPVASFVIVDHDDDDDDDDIFILFIGIIKHYKELVRDSLIVRIKVNYESARKISVLKLF